MSADFERFEVKMLAGFKARLAEAAQQEGVSLGEMIVRAACRGLGFPEDEAVPTRKLPGRKPSVPLVAEAPAPKQRKRK